MRKKEQHSNLSGESDTYRAIFEQSLTANLILSLEGEILDSNEAACKLFGYECDDLINKRIDFLFDENPADRLSTHGQIAGQTSDGSRKTFSYQYSKIEIDASRPFGILQLIDITEQSAEADYLRLLESVVKGANDAVLITSAEPLESPDGPEIVYVNHAFTKMTGYSSEDVIGKTPRILQGSETPGEELTRLRNAILNYEQVEVELINYKKNREEFWVELSLSPVFNGDRCTHFIAIERDITTRKNRENLKFLQSEISRIFNSETTLAQSLDKTLEQLLGIGDFCVAEIWLTDNEKQIIGLSGYKSEDNRAQEFYERSNNVQVFLKGEGLPGITWETGTTQFWRDLDKREDYTRSKEVHALGVKTAYGFPIHYDSKVIGVLILGLMADHQQKRYYAPLLEKLGEDLGSEIDRKQTEEQLNRIFSFAPDIICVAGIDGYFKQVNPAMSRLLGYTQDELLTHPISSFTHPDDRFKTEMELDAISKNEGNETFQNRYLTKSGEIVWLSWTTRTFSEEGIIYSIARDITEQKALKDLLKQANRLAKIGSWEIDLVNDEHYWSEVTREIHEVDPDYQPSMDGAINFYKEGDSRRRVEDAVEKAIKNGISFDLEVQIITAKGNERWIRAIGKPEQVNGKLVRLYGSFQDIHDLKSAELKQIELADERERILESIGDAFFAVDKDWIVTYWNKKAEEELFMSREDILGKNLWEVYEDATELDFYTQYHKAVNEQVTVTFEEYYPTVEKWFDVSAYPSPEGLSVFFKDITARKKSEEKLKELNSTLKQQAQELAASNAELEQFAFVASHDLQEPLRMVTSFLSQLEKKYANELDEKGKKYIWFATDGARRMRQIILDLLNYSRVGRMEIEKRAVDLNKVMETVAIDYRKTIEEKQAIAEWDSLPVISADPASVNSLLSNLVGNALKYHDEDIRPKIVVGAEETGGKWRISVSDNGIGINPEYSEKIFNIFQRLHSNDEYSGTGIGLAVCRKIVENHGGTIWMESEEGVGSTFYFTIPKK